MPVICAFTTPPLHASTTNTEVIKPPVELHVVGLSYLDARLRRVRRWLSLSSEARGEVRDAATWISLQEED